MLRYRTRQAHQGPPIHHLVPMAEQLPSLQSMVGPQRWQLILFSTWSRSSNSNMLEASLFVGRHPCKLYIGWAHLPTCCWAQIRGGHCLSSLQSACLESLFAGMAVDAVLKLSPPVSPGLPVPAEAGYPPVMDELMPRLLHMCFDDSWTQRTGGTAAIALLYNRWACAAMSENTAITCDA